MSTQAERKAAAQEVFFTHAWGDKHNSGKQYKRPYSKTAKAKEGLVKRSEARKAEPVKAQAKKKK